MRVEGCTLEEDNRRRVSQCAVSVDGVSGNPAQVSRAEENILGAVVEDVLESCRRVDHVSGHRVENTLGLASATTVEVENSLLLAYPLAYIPSQLPGVENKQRILSIHPDGLTLLGHIL